MKLEDIEVGKNYYLASDHNAVEVKVLAKVPDQDSVIVETIYGYMQALMPCVCVVAPVPEPPKNPSFWQRIFGRKN
jgi:hypothetical protein